MRKYKIDDVLKIAKRFNNKKRSYLLVNPLQGKHLPVSPNSALEMMKTLGDKIAKKYSDCKLVIGFAETATAIGATVANSLGEDCIYLQTTREKFSAEYNFMDFLEEHSHAPEQKLFCGKLDEQIKNTSSIIFVDDEISTGKTLRNIISQLKSAYPDLNKKILVVASVINRLTSENEKLLQAENINCEYLIKLDEKNFDVSDLKISAPKILESSKKFSEKIFFEEINFLSNPRLSVRIGDYMKELKNFGEKILNLVDKGESILILGTEECMLPAIIAGKILEDNNFNVVTHSTTRSPIGICQQNNYPVTEGYQIKSFYDSSRITYIYNLKYYDSVLVISDAKYFKSEVIESLTAALDVHGYGKIIFLGGRHV